MTAGKGKASFGAKAGIMQPAWPPCINKWALAMRRAALGGARACACVLKLGTSTDLGFCAARKKARRAAARSAI